MHGEIQGLFKKLYGKLVADTSCLDSEEPRTSSVKRN